MEAKVDPQILVLRGSPRKVMRFKRGLIIGIAAAAAVLVFASLCIALRPGAGSHRRFLAQAFGPAGPRPVLDALAMLPSSYNKLQLGPPAGLRAAIAPRVPDPGGRDLDGPDPMQSARAERQRLIQQARQAREAGVFFQVSAPSQVSALADGVRQPAVATVAPTGVSLSLDPAKDQNDQGRKLEFVNEKADKEIYNPHVVQTPASPYELLAGTVIPASLLTGLDSDLPGFVIAQVTRDIFDSVSGAYLLLPRGSRIIGQYDSVVAFGQSRALVVWQRLVMPDGTSIQIDNLPATDAAGYSGLAGAVDYHTWTLLKGVGLSTLLGVGSQTSFASGGDSSLVEAIRQSAQESTNQAGQKIVQKALEIQPTITVPQGSALEVVVHKDIILKPYRG